MLCCYLRDSSIFFSSCNIWVFDRGPPVESSTEDVRIGIEFFARHTHLSMNQKYNFQLFFWKKFKHSQEILMYFVHVHVHGKFIFCQ